MASIFFYIVALYIVSLLLGYVTAFSEATLFIGRSISYTRSKGGFQNAITPPWDANLGLFTYLIVAPASVIYGFIKYGWLAGIGAIVGLFFLMIFNKVILLPKKDSEHFRALIIKSMISRYANYLRDHDKLRASAMKELLERLGIPVTEITNNEGIGELAR